jgi:isocitrate lyase
VLNAFELMKAMIEAGAAGVHFEDQLASVKKCGHMGGKVLVPTREASRSSSRRGSPPTAWACRRSCSRAPTPRRPISSRPTSTTTTSRSHRRADRRGLLSARARTGSGGLARSRLRAYADLIWCETGKPDLAFAKAFAEAIQAKFPGKMLAYNCSPSFNWKKNLDDATIATFQRELGAMGYKFQFITLAGFHSLNYSMFNLAHGYARNNMSAFVELQEAEFAAAEKGFTAVQAPARGRHRLLRRGNDDVQGSQASTTALSHSTEDEQFFDEKVGNEWRREAANA